MTGGLVLGHPSQFSLELAQSLCSHYSIFKAIPVGNSPGEKRVFVWITVGGYCLVLVLVGVSGAGVSWSQDVFGREGDCTVDCFVHHGQAAITSPIF